MLTERDLELKSVQYRRALLRLIKACGAGHTGGDLSCLDIINVLYNRILRVSPETFKSPDRDYYIQSKGHCAEALQRAQQLSEVVAVARGGRSRNRLKWNLHKLT